MRLGLLPSQQRYLDQTFKKARAFDHFRQRTRRAFLGLGALALGLGIGGFAAGRASGGGSSRLGSGEVDPRLATKLDQARRLAAQTDEILRRDHATFLLVLDAVGDDETLWVGFARLANMALATKNAVDRQLAERLLATSRAASRPAHLNSLVEALQGHVR